MFIYFKYVSKIQFRLQNKISIVKETTGRIS